MNIRFQASALISIVIWGLYPAAVAIGNFSQPLISAAVSIALAALGWFLFIAFGRPDLAFLFRTARKSMRWIALSGVLMALEIALFYLAVSRSPQTAAVLFELWVISFVVVSQISRGGERLSAKAWLFLLLGFLGASVAVIDLRALVEGQGMPVDLPAALLAISSAASMGTKTYINSRVATDFRQLGIVTATTIPHLLSAWIAILIWTGLAFAIGEEFTFTPAEMKGVVAVAAAYLVGVPVFIYAVSVRSNDASMALFYTIPLVALFALFLFDVATLKYYFIVGASIIFVSNTLLAQSARYVSAAGIAAIMTLMAAYVSVSVEDGVIPRGFLAGDVVAGVSSTEAILMFYGLLFAFVVADVMNDYRTMKRALNQLFSSVFRGDPATLGLRYRAAMRLISDIGQGRFRYQFDGQDLAGELDIVMNATALASTPYTIFRIFSVGFLVVVLLAFSMSPSLFDRMTGAMIFGGVSYFLLYSRDVYFREVVFTAALEETLSRHRTGRYRRRLRDRRANHAVGHALFIFALIVAELLNVASEVF